LVMTSKYHFVKFTFCAKSTQQTKKIPGDAGIFWG